MWRASTRTTPPTTPPGDENRYIYYGSIGKLLPCFAVFGKEAHVGQAFSALDPNLVLANITRKMSLNTDLCDIAQGEVAIPPISLKQMDTKALHRADGADGLRLLQLLHPRLESFHRAGKEQADGCGGL